MFNRQKVQTHSHVARAELGESIDHFRQAAMHAAQGVGESVGPRVDLARQRVVPVAVRAREIAEDQWVGTNAAVRPLMRAALYGASQAGMQAGMRVSMARAKMARDAKISARRASRKRESWMSRKRTGLIIGLIAAGAAGAAGAYVMRRRSRSSWEEYESSGVVAMEPTLADSAQAAAERARDDVAASAEQSDRVMSDKPVSDKAAGRDKTAEHDKASGDQSADKKAKADKGRGFATPTPGQLGDKALGDKASASKNGRG